jgi:ABC-type amino acid transport substrate-binding protein
LNNPNDCTFEFGYDPITGAGNVHHCGGECGVAMRTDDTELHDIMNTGIVTLMESDKWDELLSKYEIWK